MSHVSVGITHLLTIDPNFQLDIQVVAIWTSIYYNDM